MKVINLKRIVGTFIVALFLILPYSAAASGTFIPATSRMDMVHDSLRNILYITRGTAVLRYSLETNSFLSPIPLGGKLAGIDISPDNNTLAVANLTGSGSQAWIHLVNLQTGKSRKVILPNTSGGTWSVAFDKDGAVTISTTLYWGPLLRYNPLSGETTVLLDMISDSTMLDASGDGTVIGFAEGDISDGRWGRYRVTDGNLVHREGYDDGTSWFNFEMGVNRNGTQFAMPTYGGTFFYNQNFRKIKTLGVYAGPQPIGVAYHQTKDIVYSAWAETTEVRAYDTTTFQLLATYDVEDYFDHTGNWAYQEGRIKLSRDGSLLFVTVDNGIRYLNLAKADLSVRAQVPGAAVIGQTVTYQMTVTNNGPDDATGVTLTDSLSQDMALVQVSASKGSCAYANMALNCSIGALAHSEVVKITAVLRPLAAGRYTNTITAVANEADANLSNNTLTRTTKVLGLTTFTLSANRVTGGQSVQGTVTLSDTAPSGGTIVTLTDNLSAATVPESVTIPAGKRTVVFDITTQPVTTNQSGQIIARLGSSRIGRPLTIQAAQ